jgi:hypothetical protein
MMTIQDVRGGKSGLRTALLALPLLAAGCLPSPGEHLPREAHWVEAPGEDMRVLLVPAEHTVRLEAPGLPSVDVSLGAFFARWTPAGGPVDQLAFLVVLEGGDPATVVALSDRLLLEIDGARFVGAPGESANSFRMDETETGCRITMAIPVGLDALNRMIHGDEVRAQLGDWGAFTVPRPQRMRFRSLVEQLPLGAPLNWYAADALARSGT